MRPQQQVSSRAVLPECNLPHADSDKLDSTLALLYWPASRLLDVLGDAVR